MKSAVEKASKQYKNDETEGTHLKKPYRAWSVYAETMKDRGEKLAVDDGNNHEGEYYRHYDPASLEK